MAVAAAATLRPAAVVIRSRLFSTSSTSTDRLAEAIPTGILLSTTATTTTCGRCKYRPNTSTHTHTQRRPTQRQRPFSSTRARRDDEHRYKDYGRYRRTLAGLVQRRIDGIRIVLSARVVQALAACGFLGYILNLETVEGTGRRRFNVVRPETEASAGENLYRQYLHAFRGRILPPHHPEALGVERVMDRLIPHVELDYVDWKVHVINDDSMVNAFVLPSGKVFVYTGILPIAKDQDGLAVILAHEIAHIVAHHSAERMSSWWIAMAGVAALVGLFDVSGQVSSLFMNIFYKLPNSRTMESEADKIGLMLMAEACFDPNAAYSVWERFIRFEKENSPSEFLSTHPSNFNRLQAFRELMQDAETRYRASGCGLSGRYMKGFRNASRKSD